MWRWPDTTRINQPLPKKALFAKFDWSSAQRAAVDNSISRMVLTRLISSATVPVLVEGTEVKSFYVVEVQLKQKSYTPEVLSLLAKAIPQRMLFELHYADEVQWATYQERLIVSAWMPTEQQELRPLQGPQLDTLWEHLLRDISGLKQQADGCSVVEQLKRNEARDKLLRKVALIEKRCRLEKQPRRKVELFKQLTELKQQLDTFDKGIN